MLGGVFVVLEDVRWGVEVIGVVWRLGLALHLCEQQSRGCIVAPRLIAAMARRGIASPLGGFSGRAEVMAMSATMADMKGTRILKQPPMGG